jgi:Holliday junction resolvasome RuvABC endonuclease subunit
MVIKYYLGIDPGKSGGLAVVNSSGVLVDTFKMPDTAYELFVLVSAIKDSWPEVVAYLEDVGPNAFTLASYCLGYSRGGLEVALAGNKIRIELVKPNKWQTALKCKTGGDKNVTKQTAMMLFPDSKVNHAIADAILIAEYGRKTEANLQ